MRSAARPRIYTRALCSKELSVNYSNQNVDHSTTTAIEFPRKRIKIDILLRNAAIIAAAGSRGTCVRVIFLQVDVALVITARPADNIVPALRERTINVRAWILPPPKLSLFGYARLHRTNECFSPLLLLLTKF